MPKPSVCILSYSSRSVIISLENIFSVSTNYSRDSFYVGVHDNSLFFLAIIPGVHLHKMERGY